eukprot:7761306-Pyramimonas_sp.AAC.1
MVDRQHRQHLARATRGGGSEPVKRGGRGIWYGSVLTFDINKHKHSLLPRPCASGAAFYPRPCPLSGNSVDVKGNSVDVRANVYPRAEIEHRPFLRQGWSEGYKPV